MTEPAPQLDYAPPPPAHQRRSFRRWLVYAVVAIIVFSGWFWVPRVARRFEVLYYQRLCLAHAAPPTLVAIEPDPAKAKALVALGTHIGGMSGEAAYVFDPLAAAYNTNGDCVFLHSRRKPTGGEVRLVVVDIVKINDATQLNATSIKPATLVSNARSVAVKFHAMPPGPSYPRFDYPRLYAGQVDPADDSHFTIKYEYSDRSGTIDGWLRDDDSVVLEPRDEAAADAMP
jgi:hypothetical protein